jgi:hypothetical protein
MSATFWFDPSCPYTWVTAQWLRSAAAARGDEVDWRLMSLAVLNRDGTHEEAIPAARVLAAAPSPDRGSLYAALGVRVHDRGESLTRSTMEAAIADAGLAAPLIDAWDDPARDAEVRASHDEGQSAVGQEAGSPITAMGSGPAFFGPILTEVPADPAPLYQALTLLSAVPTFAELKRSR